MATPIRVGREGRIGNEELTRELLKLQTEVSPSFWKDPQPEDVQGLYSVAVEFVLGKCVDDIRVEETHGGDISSALPSLHGLNVLPHEGQLHIRAIGNLRFLRYCQYLCRSVFGILDFNRNDLFRPTPERVHRFATAFVHFMRFQETIMINYEQQMNRLKELDAEEKAAVNEYRNMCANLRELETDRNNKMAAKEERMMLHNRMNSEAYEEKQTYMRWRKQLEEVNEAFSEAEGFRSQSDFDLTVKKQTVQDLSDKVVTSPESIRQHMEELRRRKQDVENELSDADKKRQMLDKRLEVVRKSTKRICKFLELLKTAYETAIKPQAELRAQTKQLDKQLKELKTELTSLETKKEDGVRSVRTWEGKVQQLQDHWLELGGKADYELEETKQKSAKTKEELADHEKEIESNTNKENKLLQELRAERQMYSDTCNELNKKEMEANRWKEDCLHKWVELAREVETGMQLLP